MSMYIHPWGRTWDPDWSHKKLVQTNCIASRDYSETIELACGIVRVDAGSIMVSTPAASQ